MTLYLVEYRIRFSCTLFYIQILAEMQNNENEENIENKENAENTENTENEENTENTENTQRIQKKLYKILQINEKSAHFHSATNDIISVYSILFIAKIQLFTQLSDYINFPRKAYFHC